MKISLNKIFNGVRTEYCFYSLLSKIEMQDKLTSLINREKYLKGKIDASRVVIYKRSDLFGNAYKPVLYATLNETNGQTKLTGFFKMYWIGRLASVVWVLFVGLLFSLIIFSEIIENDGGVLKAILLAIIFIAVGVAVSKFAMWLSRNDKEYILALLQAEYNQESK